MMQASALGASRIRGSLITAPDGGEWAILPNGQMPRVRHVIWGAAARCVGACPVLRKQRPGGLQAILHRSGGFFSAPVAAASSRSLACAAARRFDGSVCSAFDAAKRLLDCQAAGGEPGAPSLESASSMSRWRYDIGWVCAEVAAAGCREGEAGSGRRGHRLRAMRSANRAFPEGSLEPFFIRRIQALVCNLLVDNFGKSCVWIAVSRVFCGLEATVQLLA
ncbi:Uncharacterised protein [Streptococcus dysgalactiae subsp. equisimilis]|nr:Uncharacterised protein [Streptococcus dysgalactiae subsp. equisimilis]